MLAPGPWTRSRGYGSRDAPARVDTRHRILVHLRAPSSFHSNAAMGARHRVRDFVRLRQHRREQLKQRDREAAQARSAFGEGRREAGSRRRSSPPGARFPRVRWRRPRQPQSSAFERPGAARRPQSRQKCLLAPWPREKRRRSRCVQRSTGATDLRFIQRCIDLVSVSRGRRHWQRRASRIRA